MICASCFLLLFLLAAALRLICSPHSFFILDIFALFSLVFVWGLSYSGLVPLSVCFSDLVMRVHTIQIEYATKAAYNLYTLCFFFSLSTSFTLALVSYFLSVIIITTFLFVASVWNIRKTMCVFSTLPTLKLLFFFLIRDNEQKKMRAKCNLFSMHFFWVNNVCFVWCLSLLFYRIAHPHHKSCSIFI